MKSLWTTTLVGLAGALALAACGDDTTASPADSTLTTIFPDATTPSDTTTSPDANPAAVRTLEFEQAFGDDQKPCRQQPRCSIFISFTEQRTLKMVYSEDGVPTSGQTVKFAIENDNNNLGHLNTLSGVTDASGIAQVVAKANSANVGQFVVKAYVDGTNAPAAKYFDVVVTPKGQVPLTVVATYNGTRPVATYSVRLYRQNAQGSPGCQDLMDLYENGTANQARDNVLLAQSAKFPEFDKLETDGKQKFTILAFSQNANQAVQAWGCDATQGEVEWGKSKTVQVELTDRPPQYKGAYDVVSKFDFVSAIPEPYRTYVNYVVEFFQDPTGTILKIACDLLTDPGQTLNSFCDMVFDEVNGNLQLTALGGFVSDLLDAVIQGLLQDTVFSKIFQVGGDVADILKEFELRATFEFKKEPDASGKFADGDATENWHTVKVKWTLGANCDPDTEQGCGVRQFSMSAFQTQAINGTFKAQVANFYDLTIDMHPLNLRYGALINYFLEAFLIPLVFNNPTINSYEDLLGYLVGSGAACLDAGIDDATACPSNGSANTNCCCNKFADGVGSISGNTKNNGTVDSGTESAVAAACDVIIKTAPTFLRTTLQNLDLSSGDTFNIGTKQSCKMTDGNEDLIIDGFGTQSAPCLWNVVLKFGSSTQTTIDSKFWAKRSEE